MREIKFRMFKDGKMYSWRDIIESGLPMCSLGEMYMTNPPKPIASFMQYTGLLDKNGKEIYEGDIVAYQSYDGESKSIKITLPVLFHEGSFCVKRDDWGHEVIGRFMTVIGNVYQNPELLEIKSK